MSIRAVNWVAGLATVPPPARVILFLLANHTGKDGSCWPSRLTMREASGLCRAQYYRWQTWLVKHGYLHISGEVFRLKMSPGDQTHASPVNQTLESGKPDSKVRKTRLEKKTRVRKTRLASPGNQTLDAPTQYNHRTVIEPSILQLDENLAAKNENEKVRKRDDFFDALVEVLGMDPAVGGNGARLGKLKRDLTSISRPYSPEEVREFGRRYAKQHPYAHVPTIAQLVAQIGMVRAGKTPSPPPVPEPEPYDAGPPLDVDF